MGCGLAKRLVRDETGMTMGLTIMVMVLIGVMGAGILVFVQRDLETVVEVNRGQRALELADAGVQLARQQLYRDPYATHYDVDDFLEHNLSSLCNIPLGSRILGGLDLELFPRTGGDWSWENGGITRRNLDGSPASNDSVTVTINWLNGDASPEDEDEAICAAPPGDPESEFFRVVSTGEYNGAKRRVEAIYEVAQIGVPEGFFALQDVTVSGTANLNNTSIFSMGDVTVKNGASLLGTDLAYRSWAETPLSPLTSYPNPYNLKPRRKLLLPNAAAGIGARGTVSGGEPGRDYGNLAYPQPDPPDPSRMTFPFDPDAQPDLQTLKQTALEQEAESGERHYYESEGGTVTIGTDIEWPSDSDHRTVVYIEFTGGTGSNKVKWNVDGNCVVSSLTGLITGDIRKGTIVVEGGDFEMQGNDAPFEGVIIVRGGVYTEGDYTGAGHSCLIGYANTSGSIEIKGNAAPTNLLPIATRPGFYRVELWSWRELYE
ncbi:hypothetical protein Rxyl_1159 [Rubrobacter xylanophilus DSM 9941]|uniref:Type 4 fimbrial biogenesis protein PilX N-terminal domain-containing protein n=1 Tax=Rubrobacter xylanophilus (strain DSM 9941 / JCM 11954 / NBRC 16129 / PRD-1) TaxID=266117 RepID=Q1AWV3_RUBXD|nr:hypothetical protein [Rubrobacter xylanophilus]ABG04125.1 hypothetical protein Rxyl_1159 [Rubrobacter xylanophilus DSM 9941]